MVVCSCNVITSDSIISFLESREQTTIPSVGTVIKGIGYDGAICGTCASNIHKVVTDYFETQQNGNQD